MLMARSRREIFLASHGIPFLRPCALSRSVGLRPSTVNYHVRTLQEAGFVEVLGGAPSPAGYVPEVAREVLYLLGDPSVLAVARITRKSPGEGITRISARTGMSRQWCSRLVSEMERAGLVSVVRDGRTRRIYLGGAVEDAVELMRSRAFEYQDALIERLSNDGLAPEVLMATEEQLTVRTREPGGVWVIPTVPEHLREDTLFTIQRVGGR